MARVQGYTEDDVDVLVADFARVLQTSLLRVTTEVASRLGGAVVASTQVFHLPGKHNQKAHGHKTQVSQSDQAEFQDRIKGGLTEDEAFDRVSSSDEFTRHGGSHLGMDVEGAASEYQSDGYVINSDLRDGRSADWDPDGGYTETVATMDEMLAHEGSELDRDIVTYRGIEHPGKVWGSAWSESRSNAGLTWDDDGYGSTTPYRSIATQFAVQRSDTKLHPVRMRILVPAGQHAFTMGQHGTIKDYADEREVLLPRGGRYRIMADHGLSDKGIWDVDVEFLGIGGGDVTASVISDDDALIAAVADRIPNFIDRGPMVRVLRFAMMEQSDGTYTAPDLVDDGLVAADLTTSDVAVATQLWQAEVDGAIAPYIAEVYTGSAVQVAIGLGTAFPDGIQPGVPVLPDDFAVTYLKTLTNQLDGMGDDIWEGVRNELLDGMQTGASVEQIAAKIKNVGNFTTSEAQKIARTYIHSAAESGSVMQMRFVGYADDEVTKEWLTVHDARVRETHVHADHQTVQLNQKFTVGGWPLDHPGDLTAPASETANCRCTTIFDVDTAPKLRCTPTIVGDANQSSVCVTPVAHVDISHIPSDWQSEVYDRFAAAKITPAYGGAKIFKVIEDVLKKLAVDRPDIAGVVDRDVVLAIVDAKYPAKAATFGQKFEEWAQSAAGKKALGGTPKLQAVKTPITIDAPSEVVPTVPKIPLPSDAPLPPIPAAPSPTQLTFTGKVFSSATKPQVWVDNLGQKWLFKTVPGGTNSYSAKTLLDLETAIARIQSKAKVTRPAIYHIELNGKPGTIQYMFDSTDAFPHGSFDPLKLSAEDLLTMQQEQIFDWMISNHDTHSGQWLRLPDGRLLGIDKGQAFKFFGKDKLSWDYVPVTPLGDDTLTYTRMWKAFVSGKDIGLQDPTQGALGAYIDQLVAIPDAEYRKLLTPYAKWRESMGFGSSDSFLDAAVLRKNSLKTDFADFWARATKERAKALGLPLTPPATVAAPVATALPTASVTSTGIEGVSQSVKKIIADQWVKLGGGKKVTPGYGGAKIFKMLEQLKAYAQGDPELGQLTELQLLRILDEQHGFKGKSKTYETVVKDWLASPAGDKAVLFPPPSLKAPISIVAPPAPVAQPVIAISSETNAAELAFSTQIAKPLIVIDTPTMLENYGVGETIGYIKLYTHDGPYMRIVRAEHGFTVDAFQGGAWKTGSTVYSDGYEILAKFDVYGSSFVQAESKLAAKTPSLIPGKVPGDIATPKELLDSMGSWESGDIVATTNIGPTQYRLVSNSGSFRIDQYDPDNSLWFATAYNVKESDLQGVTWILGNDVIKTKATPSLIEGVNAGDVVDANKLWYSKWSYKGGQAVAFAYDDNGKYEYRLMYAHNGNLTIRYRNAGSHDGWKLSHQVSGPDDVFLKKFKWRMAKLNGDAPDAHLAALPKSSSSTPSPGVSSPFPGKIPGDSITVDEMMNGWSAIPSHDIIATGTGAGDIQYRIYWLDDTHLAMEYKAHGGGWDFVALVDKDAAVLKGVKWQVGSGKASPASVGVKKATHHAKMPQALQIFKNKPVELPGIPGKTPADLLSIDDIFNATGGFHDGDIIAVGIQTNKWTGEQTKFRVFQIDGVLVLQKQSKSGTWIGTKIVSNKWAIPGAKWHTVEGNEAALTKAQFNSAKKAVEKHKGTAKPAKKIPTSTSAPKPFVSPTVEEAPFSLRKIDLSLFSQAEQQEIYELFSGGSSIQSYTPPETVWGIIQAVKHQLQTKYGGKYNDLNELQILRIVDAYKAAKAGKTDEHLLEKKIVTWLKTPKGKEYVARRIDAPVAARDVPAPMEDFASAVVDADAQKYEHITTTQALDLRKKSYAKYGEPTAKQKSSLRTYTGGAFSDWNAAIRRGDISHHRQHILQEQGAMRPSVEPMLLHRGTSFLELNDPSIVSYETLLPHVGQTYINRGFMSTSVGGSAAFHGELLIEVEAPIGTPMAYVADFSKFPNERETTLTTHLIFKILSVKKKGATTIMRVRVIGVAQP